MLRVVLAEKQVSFRALNGILVHEMVVRSISKEDEPRDGALSTDMSIDVDGLRSAIKAQLDEVFKDSEGPVPEVPLELQSFTIVAFVQEGDDGKVLQTTAVDVEGQLTAPKTDGASPK
jgi:hypothetical protein